MMSFKEWKKRVRQFERSMGILDVYDHLTYEQRYEEEKQRYLKKLRETEDVKQTSSTWVGGITVFTWHSKQHVLKQIDRVAQELDVLRNRVTQLIKLLENKKC